MHLCCYNWEIIWFHFGQNGISVDPFQVEAIVQLPPLRNIRQLESLQGKVYFFKFRDICSCRHRSNISRCFFNKLKTVQSSKYTLINLCMNHIFHKKLSKFLLVFFDDLLTYNRTWEEHIPAPRRYSEHYGK